MLKIATSFKADPHTCCLCNKKTYTAFKPYLNDYCSSCVNIDDRGDLIDAVTGQVLMPQKDIYPIQFI
jgi:hypothetical protein